MILNLIDNLFLCGKTVFGSAVFGRCDVDVARRIRGVSRRGFRVVDVDLMDKLAGLTAELAATKAELEAVRADRRSLNLRFADLAKRYKAVTGEPHDGLTGAEVDWNAFRGGIREG